MRTIHPLCTTSRHILAITSLLAVAQIPALGQQILTLAGSGQSLPGQTTDPTSVQVGDSFLYTGIGNDNGTPFDAIVTIIDKSANASTTVDGNPSLISISAGDFRSSWVRGSIRMILGGSSTPGNPFGTPLVVAGVTQFTARDIDSTEGFNFTDVFGLNRSTGSPSLGSGLQTGGLLQDFGQPIAGFQYVRAIPDNPTAASTSLDWTNAINSSTTNPNYAATWSYSNETISTFDFVWGTTSNVLNDGDEVRGMNALIEFSGVTPAIPEPSAALLGPLASLLLLRCRRRPDS